MPDMIKCALNIVKYSKNISKIDFLSKRVLSLSFDVISHVLETGPGWRLVSPHFSYLLDSAIFLSLVMNEKDISEWEEDAEEYTLTLKKFQAGGRIYLQPEKML